MSEIREKKRPLSLEETVDLLGAESPEYVGPLPLDPIGMRALAAKIGARLVSKRGRPTDTSWTLTRKVPMKESTWWKLKELAETPPLKEIHVAAGQLAAIALECGLPGLLREIKNAKAAAARSRFFCYEACQESRDEAEALFVVVSEEGSW